MKNSNQADPIRNNPFGSSIEKVAPFALPAAKFGALQALRQHNILSRSSIADAIGYSASKITAVVNDLIEEGILVELEDGKSSGGRRPRNIGFNPQFGYVVTVTIGLTKLDIALVDFTEHIRIRRMIPINIKDGPDKIISSICQLVLDRIEQLSIPLGKIYGFGITVPGALDPATRTPFETPLMPGWGGYQINTIINQTFPYAAVVVEKDANAMAFGELRKGRGNDFQNFIYVKVGRHIDAGVILNSQIYYGANGRAGDIGQTQVDMLSQTGGIEIHPLNAVASGNALAQAAVAYASKFPNSMLASGNFDSLSARDVATAAIEGDELALYLIDRTGTAIGKALSNIVNFLDPELILIGGGVSNIGHQFLAAIRRSILDRSPSASTQDLQVELAPLGSEASLIGATALALESIFVLDT